MVKWQRMGVQNKAGWDEKNGATEQRGKGIVQNYIHTFPTNNEARIERIVHLL